MKHSITIVIAALFITSCNDSDKVETDPDIMPLKSNIAAPSTISYSIIAQHPHDTSAYTQGLELHEGKMYEATGDYEGSSLRITDYKTGKVEKKHMMGSSEIFGEGITILDNKIYQLTWQSHIVYVYNILDITKPIKTFNWPYEGWGITSNGKDLIVSDGSSNIYFVNPEDFRVRTTISVQTNEGPLNSINELEFVDGFLYANIYTTNTIVKIDPESGHVVGRMEFDNLLQQSDYVPGRTDYFNGIAYDSVGKTMFITGKRWPKLFEIKLN
jgi:glutamine cyclotransferase